MPEKRIASFGLAMLNSVLLAFTIPTAAVAGESSWSAVVDLAGMQLGPTGQLHWESAVYRSLGSGHLHLEFDGDGQAFSGTGGAQLQALYEEKVRAGTAVWIGGEHDTGTSPWNALDVGACVQASDALYGETSLFIDGRDHAFHQVKLIATQALARHLYLEPRLVLNSGFQDDRQRNMAAGPSALSLALRLRLKTLADWHPMPHSSAQRLLDAPLLGPGHTPKTFTHAGLLWDLELGCEGAGPRVAFGGPQGKGS